MEPKQTEACGRCSMSTVVDAARDDDDGDGDGDRNPFADERIEVDRSELARVSPAVLLASLSERLDAVAYRLTYGRGDERRPD